MTYRRHVFKSMLYYATTRLGGQLRWAENARSRVIVAATIHPRDRMLCDLYALNIYYPFRVRALRVLRACYRVPIFVRFPLGSAKPFPRLGTVSQISGLKLKQRWSLPTCTSCSSTAESSFFFPSHAQLWDHCLPTLIPPKPISLAIRIRIPCSRTVLGHLNNSWVLESYQHDRPNHSGHHFTRRRCVSSVFEVESHF